MASDTAIAAEETILIIDDSPDNLRVLSKTLQAYGYAVRCVTNSVMAFASIQNSPPSLILLDIRMPEISGYELCQQLKQNPDIQDIPIIFLSALNEVQDVVKAFQVGGVDYITKPFQTEEVIARIQNQLTIQNLKKRLFVQNQSLLREIDERKKFEQALCQEIQRRTLIEASLQDAKNAAEAANFVKTKFLSQMSHELRTPLNIILGFTALLREESAFTSAHQDYLATINESAEQLLKIINTVLSLTRTESSQLSLEEQEFDLHHLLDSIVVLWHPKALEKGLNFEFHRTPEVPQHICADESKLRQILMNLLEKAIQTTDRGHIKIKIDVESQPSFPNEKFNLIIQTQDTREETLLGEIDTVFQLFSQDTFSQTPSSQDTAESNQYQKVAQDLGLSLLLIRQLAQLMRGNVTLTSSAEQENIVRVSLLVQAVNSPSKPSRPQPYTLQSIPENENLTMEALKPVMPESWLLQLHHAAVKGFDRQILQLLQEIPISHAASARTLEGWARNFQFDRIIEITQQFMQ